MQPISILFFVFLAVYSVHCFRIDKDEINSASMLCTKLKELFQASNQNDTERIEGIFKFLGTLDPDEVHKLLDANSINNYTRDLSKYVPNRIEAAGYPVEDHEIITDDGYILHVFRIPFGMKSPSANVSRPPILLMHGLMDSSNGFIDLGPESSLAYLLADAGYDVWLGNARGTEPSRTHVQLNPRGLRQKMYWSFSWHEIGVVDTTAIIDHILNKTNQKKLTYIGFSQGTTSFLAMASTRPEYNQKLLDVYLMAPVSSLKNISHKLYKTLAKYYIPLKTLAKLWRIYKLNPNEMWPWKLIEFAHQCSSESNLVTHNLLANGFFDSKYLNAESMEQSPGYIYGGASARQIMHYGQMIRHEKFCLFDYDNRRINRRIYGSDEPPPYDLKKITAPVNLYYSKGDDLATFENAIELASQLQNVRSAHLVSIDNFSHGDFIFSHLAKQHVYKNMISSINKINGKL